MTKLNSPKTTSIIGIVLIVIAIIFSKDSLIMTFSVLSGFLFFIISLVKIILKKYFKKNSEFSKKFWITISVILPLFFFILSYGNKHPSPQKIEVQKTETIEQIAEAIKPTETPLITQTTSVSPTKTVTQAPTSTPTPSNEVTEDYVRFVLTSNNIIYKDSLGEIKILDNLGTENNSTDKIVHIYFKPLSIWNEEEIASQASEKAIKSMKLLFSNPNITHIVFWTLGDFTDSYGNTKEETALRVGLDITTAKKIDWDTFIPMVELDYKKLFEIADEKYVHQAIAKTLNWSWR